MGKKKSSSSSSNESFGSAHSSLTVVPSKDSTRSSVTIKGNSSETYHSLDKKSNTPTKAIIKHGAKSNGVIKGKEGSVTKLKRAKSVGNIPNKGSIKPFVVNTKSKPIVAHVEEQKTVPKCIGIPPESVIKKRHHYQSDHKPVIVYLPGLFDGKINAYVITYNENGYPGTYDIINDIKGELPLLPKVQMIFIGIQEGDAAIKLVFELINTINAVFNFNDSDESAYKFNYNFNSKIIETVPHFASPNYMTRNLSHPYPAFNIKNYYDRGMFSYNTRKGGIIYDKKPITINTYSTGKECFVKWNSDCLANGCYVLIKNKSGLTVSDTGEDIIMKEHIFTTTTNKHCAWAVIKQKSTGIKHVFASCHLEYSDKYDHKTGDLLGYNKRKEQLDGYIDMLYKKYGDAKRFIFCGDTNMRMLTSALYEHESKKNYILDQMLYYLMQCDTSKEDLKSIKAIRAYTELGGDVSMYEKKNEKHVFELDGPDSFWSCQGCDVEMGRKMLLYRLGGQQTFCSHVVGKIGNKPKCHDMTQSLLGKDILGKFNSVAKYVKENKEVDRFAGYCMNPEFICGGHKFRAYDFSYKDLNDNCNMNTIWDVYNYGPTATFSLDGPTRVFDYAKRVKSGNILAPAVVDRVFMFEPHVSYNRVDNTKVGFIKY